MLKSCPDVGLVNNDPDLRLEYSLIMSRYRSRTDKDTAFNMRQPVRKTWKHCSQSAKHEGPKISTFFNSPFCPMTKPVMCTFFAMRCPYGPHTTKST